MNDTFDFECSRCDSFGRFKVEENPRCECDETEDRLTAERDAARADVDNIREALAHLIDALAQQGAPTWERSLERACILTGRYVEPYTTLRDPNETRTARLLADWHEDDGDALWWMLPVREPPYCGTPLDDDWPFEDDEQPVWTALVVPDSIARDRRRA